MNVFTFALILIGIVAVLMFTPTKAGSFLRAFGNLFFEKRAQTPEGAEAFYSELISEQKDLYKAAHDNFQNAAGRLHTCESTIKRLENQLKSIEQDCEALASAQNIDGLRVKAIERQGIMAQIDANKDVLPDLKAAFVEAKQVCEDQELEIKRLEQEKIEVVTKLKTSQDIKAVYDQLDKIKANNNTQKFTQVAKQGAEEARSKAVGARIVHEGKLDTKLQRATQTAESAKTDKFVQDLLSKHKK